MQYVKSMLAALALASTTQLAHADWSANIGWASDYYFRGVKQKSSSVSAGLDYARSGFYAGTWVADVGGSSGSGLEVDGYFGYAGSVREFDYSIGYTGYFYTGDFDDTYQELNLSAGYGFVTFDAAFGQYDNFGGPTQDYGYYALSIAHNGFYGRYATFDRDFSGHYFEAGYATAISEIDVSVYAVVSDADLTGDDDEALVFTIGKSFDF